MINQVQQSQSKVKKQLETVDRKELKGIYVVYDATKGRKIVASGPDPCKLFIEARKMNVSIPTLEYTPGHNNFDVI